MGGFFYCVIAASGARPSFMMTSDRLGRVPLAGVTIWNLCRYQTAKHTTSIMTKGAVLH